MKAAIGAKGRRLFVRLGLVICYFGLATLMFVLGKGHTVIVDNKGAEDGSYSAIDGVMVSVDGLEPLEMYSGDRDKAVLKGQSHKLIIETISSGEKVEKRVSLPIDQDLLILSIPKLVAGIEPAIEPFKALPAPPHEDSPGEEGGNFGGTEAVAAPTAP
jgi:hypothetical protein